MFLLKLQIGSQSIPEASLRKYIKEKEEAAEKLLPNAIMHYQR